MKKFLEKFAELVREGLLTKLLLLVVTAAVSLFPFISIQKKLKGALGDQPEILGFIYLSTFVIVFAIVWALYSTRPAAREKKERQKKIKEQNK